MKSGKSTLSLNKIFVTVSHQPISIVCYLGLPRNYNKPANSFKDIIAFPKAFCVYLWKTMQIIFEKVEKRKSFWHFAILFKLLLLENSVKFQIVIVDFVLSTNRFSKLFWIYTERRRLQKMKKIYKGKLLGKHSSQCLRIFKLENVLY